MKVLIIAQYYPPDMGGSATRAYNVANGLFLNACDVIVITAFPHYPYGKIPASYRWKPLKIENFANIKVIRTFMPPIKSEGFFKRIILRSTFAITALFALPIVGKVDAIWASSWIPGYAYSKIKQVPLALNVDDLTLDDLVDLKIVDEASYIVKAASHIYRLFFVKGDILTPISSGYFDIMSKKYRVNPTRIHLLRGGVDLSIFKRSKGKPQVRKKFVVLYSGSFSVAYDFEQVFKAAKVIEETDNEVEFVIQGAGELLHSMRESLKKLDVKGVKIVNKILSRDEVGSLLGDADALILPLASFYASGKPYRGMSSKLYEYQAVGKPILCCSKGVPSEYVKETRSGLVITPGDFTELARAVLKLKQNPDLCKTMGENGRKYVESEASIEATGLMLKGLLLKC